MLHKQELRYGAQLDLCLWLMDQPPDVIFCIAGRLFGLCGHVDSGNSYDQAAAAEVDEELGLKDIELKTVATYRYNTTSVDHIINQFTRADTL